MKKFSLPRQLPLCMLGIGLWGMLLRFWLYANGRDEKGLLVTGHPANILTWVLAGAVVLFVFVACLPLKEANKFRFNFPASVTSALGCLAAALGVLADALGHFGGDVLQKTTGVFGIISAAALLFISFCRLKGRYPSVVFNGFISIYLMLTLVGLYREWSAKPQLQDYVFPLLACVFVMLGCFHDAAFAAHAGSRRKHTFHHMMAVYFCLVSLPRNENALFYLALAVWMLTGHCNLTPMTAESQPADPSENTEEGPTSAELPEEAAETQMPDTAQPELIPDENTPEE